GTAPTQTAVNTPPTTGGTGQLPANHPAVDSEKPVQARPLTPEQMQAAQNSPNDSTSNAAAGGIAELPPIEPLPASSKEERAEQKYKNIQVLKGISASSLLKVMFAFKESLGVECSFCHVPDHFDKDDKQNKQTARKMITMMRETNQKVSSAVGQAG